MKRDSVAVIGVATSDFGELHRRRDGHEDGHKSAYDLGAEVFAEALRDAGIERDEVDGLITARLPSYVRMADMLGLRRPSFTVGLEGAGRTSAVALQIAAAAVESGLATTVALIYGNDGRSAGATYGGDEGPSPTGVYDTAYGMTSPGAYVSLMYQRYKDLYAVPDLALAPLAMSNRSNAALNPQAVMRQPLTIEDYAAAPFIAEPLRRLDYCLINDGAIAIIVTSTQRARRLNRPLVTLSATAACGDLTNYYSSPDFYHGSCQAVADQVFGSAGVRREDIDCAQIYDNFTPTILFSLEGFGYCPPGTAWKWVQEGRIERGGELPINTSGGHTSESYMQGWALHVEAVRQLRGEAGDRQVPDCELVQYMCVAPIASSHVFRRQ
jgi:acetyl-CoA acetyltransferase